MNVKQFPVRVFSLFLILAFLFAPVAQVQAQPPRVDSPTNLFFSEFIEGSSNNKALEIYNGTGAPVDLAAGGYNIKMYFNGNPLSSLTINLTGSVANGDVYVVAHSSANEIILAQADQTNGAGWFNGDDAVGLYQGDTALDIIGKIGEDPGTQWGSDLTSTADNTLRRMAGICAGDPDGSDAFDPSVQWDGFAIDTFDGLGSHTASCGGAPVDTAPTVSSTDPSNGAGGVVLNADLSVTFSEPVTVADGGFSLNCTASGDHTLVVTGGDTVFTLNPESDFVDNETCTATVAGSLVTDLDEEPNNMAGDYVWSFATPVPDVRIHDIQGSGSESPMVGDMVSDVPGVVTFKGFSGFYMQDTQPDDDPATSEGIFVFGSKYASAVNIGDAVEVSGKVAEYSGLTELNASEVTVDSSGSSVAPTVISLPKASPDAFEAYEGMLVTFTQPLVISEYFNFDYRGEIVSDFPAS